MGFLNSILENYKLCIKSNQVRVKKADLEDENKTKDTVYTLEVEKNYDTTNELIQYKIDKGYIMHDTNNIRPNQNNMVQQTNIITRKKNTI